MDPISFLSMVFCFWDSQAVVKEDFRSHTGPYVDTLALCTMNIAVYFHRHPSNVSRDRSA